MSKLVHQLTAADRASLTRHFLQLDESDRRLRFGIAIDDDGIRSYCGKLDFDQGALFGVYGASLELDGVAHLALWNGAAEVGLSVLSRARGAGIGGLLFDRAALHARNMGIAELFMHCLRENEAIRHIAKRAGMRIISEAGEADAYLELPKPTPLTIGQELYEQQCALIDWTLMNQLAQAERAGQSVNTTVRKASARKASTPKASTPKASTRRASTVNASAVTASAKCRPAPPSSILRAADSSRNTRVSP